MASLWQAITPTSLAIASVAPDAGVALVDERACVV